MWYTYYMNEKMVLDNWAYYKECNWLMKRLLTLNYDNMSIEEMVDYYYANRNEIEYDDEDSSILAIAQQPEVIKYYDKVAEAYNEWVYDYRSYQVINGQRVYNYPSDEPTPQKPKDLLMFEMALEREIDGNGTREKAKDIFEEMTEKNKRNNMKIREINTLTIYQDDIDAIQKVKIKNRLTKAEIEVIFGLIMLSRINQTNVIRLNNKMRIKGFLASFGLYMSLDTLIHAMEKSELFEFIVDDFEEISFCDLEVNDLYNRKQKIYYKNYETKDKVRLEYGINLANNRINFSNMIQEIAPELLSTKCCESCGCLIEHKSNRQKYCDSCKKEINKEQARLRKQKQRAKESRKINFKGKSIKKHIKYRGIYFKKKRHIEAELEVMLINQGSIPEYKPMANEKNVEKRINKEKWVEEYWNFMNEHNGISYCELDFDYVLNHHWVDRH